MDEVLILKSSIARDHGLTLFVREGFMLTTYLPSISPNEKLKASWPVVSHGPCRPNDVRRCDFLAYRSWRTLSVELFGEWSDPPSCRQGREWDGMPR